MMKKIECFRAAVKALVLEKPKGKGRKDFKQEIANYAGVKLSYINDLALGRRVGNEDTRDKVAEFFGYEEYSDFLLLGEQVIKKATLDEARIVVDKQQTMRPSPDGYIEVILMKWQIMSSEDKLKLRQLQRMLEFEKTPQHIEIEKFKEHSKERFLCLWQSSTGIDQPPPLTMEVLELLSLYEQEKVSDIEILERADEHHSI